jgi:hypothetical protein
VKLEILSNHLPGGSEANAENPTEDKQELHEMKRGGKILDINHT